jgi:tryptophanyl-tRNA synthetase
MHYYREVARKNKYKIADSFILPDRQIKSIKDPTKKMSKSLGDDHCIYLDDTFEDINRKISKSPTTPE